MKTILHISLILVFSNLLLFSCKESPTDSIFVDSSFPDANFETVIREVLNKPSGNITDVDLLTITEIDGKNRGISDISGIEKCTNLQYLNLDWNQIIDISVLGSLMNLQELNLDGNQIVEIGALSGITNLKELILLFNKIIDIKIFI